MSAHGEQRGNGAAGAQDFATTHWSVVLAAGQVGSPGAAEALEKLCRDYWYPLYAYARRRGQSVEEAQDLTQEFFARFLAGNSFSRADPGRGRFRTFLLSSFQNLIADDWTKGQRIKRGGGCQTVSLDEQDMEQRYQNEPADHSTPERLFDKAWASKVLEHGLTRLQEEFNMAGKLNVFSELKIFLPGSNQTVPYVDVALQLGMREEAVKMAAHRLRRRYGELVRAEVANTLADPRNIEEETGAFLNQ